MRAGTWRVVAFVWLLIGFADSRSVALGWSREGHRLVATIAEHRLQPRARATVGGLLRGDPRGSTLPQVATWADDVRDSRPQTYNWHFVNIPVGASAYDAARDCRPDDAASRGDCLLGALDREIATLRDAGRPRRERAEALKFVTHLLGDLHQPLHCADRHHDRGGNRVLVTFFGHAYEPPPSGWRTHWNLHAVWDYALLEHAQLDERTYARRLEAWLAMQDARALARGTLIEWANESHAVAVAHAYRQADGSPLPVKGARLGQAYFDANIAVADRQLARAGVRLAKVLNDAFR